MFLKEREGAALVQLLFGELQDRTGLPFPFAKTCGDANISEVICSKWTVEEISTQAEPPIPCILNVSFSPSVFLYKDRVQLQRISAAIMHHHQPILTE